MSKPRTRTRLSAEDQLAGSTLRLVDPDLYIECLRIAKERSPVMAKWAESRPLSKAEE